MWTPPAPLAVVSSHPLALPAGGSAAATGLQLSPHPAPEPWSVQHAKLYRLQTEVVQAGGAAPLVLDCINTTVGFRDIVVDPDRGLLLNSERVILRGFSNHNDMGGVGVAMPLRLHLFRAQQVRALGANSWRCSHNPPDPATLEVLSRLGLLTWDEVRDFISSQIEDMAALVKRDRNQATVAFWSVGNEIELHIGPDEPDKGLRFRAAIKALDTSRPVTGNMNKQSSDALVGALDVIGVSHNSVPGTPVGDYVSLNYSFAWLHKQYPAQPVVSSESSSCRTQRGEHVVNASQNAFDSSFSADCLAKTDCPRNTTTKHDPTRCLNSWTVGYNDDGSILPFLVGDLGIWTAHDCGLGRGYRC